MAADKFNDNMMVWMCKRAIKEANNSGKIKDVSDLANTLFKTVAGHKTDIVMAAFYTCLMQMQVDFVDFSIRTVLKDQNHEN